MHFIIHASYRFVNGKRKYNAVFFFIHNNGIGGEIERISQLGSLKRYIMSCEVAHTSVNIVFFKHLGQSKKRARENIVIQRKRKKTSPVCVLKKHGDEPVIATLDATAQTCPLPALKTTLFYLVRKSVE